MKNPVYTTKEATVDPEEMKKYEEYMDRREDAAFIASIAAIVLSLISIICKVFGLI